MVSNLKFLLVLAFLAFVSCQSGAEKDKLFTLLKPSRTGIDFNNALTETHEMNVIIYQDFYSGGGVAIGDIDNDGRPDVFLTGNVVPAKLYKNLGDFRFSDITEQAGLADMGPGWYTGTTMVDINNDGFLDIFIGKSGLEEPENRQNLLYINQGDGTFVEKARDYGLDHAGYAVNATFFDYDNDGDLDMYLVNQGPEKYEGGNAEFLRDEVHEFAGDKLYENTGNGFIDVTTGAGIHSSIIGFAHGVSAGDINDDGWEDLYVSNDFFEHDYIYLNNGDKTFREVTKSATKHISYFSMGNDMADYNNDGLLDVIVLDMVAEDNRRLKENLGGMKEGRFSAALRLGYHYQYMFNVLHLNNGVNPGGDITYSEVGHLAGVSTTDWSWAPVFADFNNDGWKDLYVTNGIRKDIRNIDWGKLYHKIWALAGNTNTFTPGQWDMLLNSMPSKRVPNYMFRNNGDLTFSKVSDEWGLSLPSFSNGIAYGDLDGDGDLDLVVNNIDDPAFVFENHAGEKKGDHWLRIQLSGNEKNVMAIGTKIRIYHGNQFQYQQHYLTRGYRSSMEPIMHFGLGKDTLVNRIEVTWPDGRTSLLENIVADQVITININTAGKGTFAAAKSDKRPLFSSFDEYPAVDYKHTENDIDDFFREPLLPYQYSMLGPALAIGDVNMDGLDDFFVGGAFRYPGALFLQKPDGSFEKVNEELWWEERLFEDTGAVFFDADNDGDPDLYVVSGGNEFKEGTEGLQDRLYLNDGRGRFHKDTLALPVMLTSGSRAVPFDYDDDGDIDLFVGGRQVPGGYPKPADSYLLENRNGKFFDVTAEKAPDLKKCGMVTDAVWIDFDLDGDADLVLAGEWMPITILENRNGNFRKIENVDNGLEHSAGWWFSLAAHDFDGDGDEDLVAGNLGFNYKYKASFTEPFEVYYMDYDRNNFYEIILAYRQDGKQYPVNDRVDLVTVIPALGDKYPENDPFSLATVSDIFGDSSLENALHYKAYTFASSYIENLGNGRFRLVPLHNLAQITSQKAILCEDIDQDGQTDIVLAGNLHGSEVETIRNDAGIGLFLKGDGKGNFDPVPYQQSGLYMDGDVKNMQFISTSSGKLIISARNSDALLFIRLNQGQQIAEVRD
jgi:enediyne biosynthesis protein E4